jgi:phosphomannomutase/phosphomannomutase/phosphoglucomutase
MEDFSTTPLSCFKAYDIRGRFPAELNCDLAYRIGRSFAKLVSAEKLAVGQDVRLSSPQLTESLCNGILDQGVHILDLGLCGTEEVYFATMSADIDGGIMVTASHNPAEYNGMKLILGNGVPPSGKYSLANLKQLVQGPLDTKEHPSAKLIKAKNRNGYINWLLGRINLSSLTPLTIVVNCGNGCAGPVVDALKKHLPFTFITLQYEPDGTFPNGVPNPLLPENRELTSHAVLASNADLGIAWDGDFDRCFLFNEKGEFIESYYMVGLLASLLLRKYPGEKIIHDTRLIWNTQEMVEKAGGTAVMNRAGHSYFKDRMRLENGLYGGEMSGHHFFRDFSFCDSGMLPWLLVCEELCQSGKSLSQLTDTSIKAYPVSGEINISVASTEGSFARVEQWCDSFQGEKDYTDGLSFSTGTFRINLRRSHTEPLLRLNIETKADRHLLSEITEQLLKVIRP